jgi:hypothetical protein
MQGRHALGDSAQDLHDCGTARAGLPANRAAEQLEERTARKATLVGNDRPAPALGRLIGREWLRARTVQAVWVQNVQQELITRQFIKQAIKLFGALGCLLRHQSIKS